MENNTQPSGQQFTAEELLEANLKIHSPFGIRYVKRNHPGIYVAVITSISEADQQALVLRQELKERTDYADSKSKEVAALQKELDIERHNHDHAKEVINQQDTRTKELESEYKMWRSRFLEQKKLVIEKDARIKVLENEILYYAKNYEDLEAHKDKLREVLEETYAGALKDYEELEAYSDTNFPYHKWRQDARVWLDACKCRLSSGETKPPESPDSSTIPAEYPGKDYQMLCDHLFDEHGIIAIQQDMDEIISIVHEMDGKPASQWISVEDKLPVVGERYNFINDIEHSIYYGEIFGGKYMGERFGYHEFSLPGHCMTAKYYCPIPVPTESLTGIDTGIV